MCELKQDYFKIKNYKIKHLLIFNKRSQSKQIKFYKNI